MIVQAERLNKWYGRVIALNEVSLTVSPGVTGLLGPNGAGKTSLLRIVIGLMRESSGTIRVLGERPWNNPRLAVRIGYCPEHDGFYEWMKAEDPKQPRQPWRFTVDGGAPFAFAGLCTRKEWEDPEDRGFDDGWLYSCTIVTTTPNELVAKVHDRMPAILPGPDAEALQSWQIPGSEFWWPMTARSC